jgi:hypothetical protein
VTAVCLPGERRIDRHYNEICVMSKLLQGLQATSKLHCANTHSRMIDKSRLARETL